MQMRVGKGFFAEQLGTVRPTGRRHGRLRLADGGTRCWWRTTASWPGRLDDPSLDGLRCIMGIPLKSDRQVQGVIGLAHVDRDRAIRPGRRYRS
jgi:hypothetical protein